MSERRDWDASQYRDGFIIAFLAALPVRMANLSGIELGRQLIWRNGAYWLVLTAEETKNGNHYEAPLPDDLTEYADRYLKHYRHRFLKRRRSTTTPPPESLWVNRYGNTMDPSAIHTQIKFRTVQAFGHKVWPHLFRDCAATSTAIEDPEHLDSASDLLGHGVRSTLHRHYKLRRALGASRLHQAHVRELRRRAKERKVIK